LSNQYDTEAQVNKLKINMLITVFVMTYIISEQLKMDILTVLQAGIGETIKEGTPIATVMPSEYDICRRNLCQPFRFAFNFQRCQNKNGLMAGLLLCFQVGQICPMEHLEAELLPLKNSLVIMENSEYLLP
jgi:hypothetical protein